MFFDEPVDIARYDSVKYQQFELLSEKQLSFFWRPQEILLTKDSKDFKNLTSHEQFMFTENLKRQILLDSVQGRAPLASFGPICSLPEIERWLTTWTFSETIHSLSYTHIIRNIYPDPSKVFDTITDIQEIVDCAKDISKYYDQLNQLNLARDTDNRFYDTYEHKKALWLALNAVNALEGIRFYVSFIVSWSFAERKTMEGNAAIIRLICKDENLHLASTQKMINMLSSDDPDFIKISKDCEPEVLKMFDDVVNQEKQWADYLFKNGSTIGLNAEILKTFVEYIAGKRMSAIGLISPYKVKADPLPWSKRWITGQDVQKAPQEVQLTEYKVGETSMDISENTFEGFTL